MSKEEIKAIIKELFLTKEIVIIARPSHPQFDPVINVWVYIDNEQVAWQSFDASDKLPLLPNN